MRDDAEPPNGSNANLFCRLASEVAQGHLTLTRAIDRVKAVDPPALQYELDQALQLPAAPRTDLAELRALLELGLAAASVLDSAYYFINYALNLGQLLCAGSADVPRGLALLEQALAQTGIVQLTPQDRAQVILTVADAYVTHHGQMGPAYLEVANKAYQTCIVLLGTDAGNALLKARAHGGLGLCLAEHFEGRRMVHASRAINEYQQALRYLETEPDRHYLSLILHNLGNAYRHSQEGDRAANLQHARECLERALSIRKASGNKDRILRTLSTLAGVELDMGHGVEALSRLEEAVELHDPIHERVAYATLHLDLALYALRTSHLVAQGEAHCHSLALAYAVVARESLDRLHETALWAEATRRLAQARMAVGQLESAIRLQEEVLALASGTGMDRQRALVCLDYAQALAARAQRRREAEPELAQQDCALAGAVLETVPDGALEPDRRWFIAGQLALVTSTLEPDAARAHQHRLQARVSFSRALDSCTERTPVHEKDGIEEGLIETLTALHEDDELVSLLTQRLENEADFVRSSPSIIELCNYTKAQRPHRDRLIEVLLRRGDLPRAWWAADEARARLLDCLANAQKLQAGGEVLDSAYVPERVRQHHASLVRAWLTNLDAASVEQGLRRDAIAPWLRESFLQVPYWRGHWAMRGLTSKREIDLGTLEFADVSTALIEYWCGQDDVYAFVWLQRTGSLHAVPLPELRREVLQQLVLDWFERYSDYEHGGPVEVWAQHIEAVCRWLGRACWDPLRFILESAGVTRLVLLPEMGLEVLPLHAMVVGTGADERRLCDDYEVSFCPSLRQLARSRTQEGPVPPHGLFLGNPQAVCPTGNCGGECTLALPGSEVERAVLQTTWPSVQCLKGNACTVRAVLDAVHRLRPGLLHASTHGVARFEDPLGSGLVLAYDGQASEDPLTLYVNHELGQTWGEAVSGELLTLDRLLREAALQDCRLAVLNACEQGVGYPTGGGESVSVAVGFLAVGVPTVIAPLWHIADSAAGLLTRRFYELLRRDPGRKLKALMEAQRWLRTLSLAEAQGLAGVYGGEEA